MEQVSHALDKIANELEAHGLSKLAHTVDKVTNTLERRVASLEKTASSLDFVADLLQNNGMTHLASTLDVIANTIEKFARYRQSMLPPNLAFDPKASAVPQRYEAFMKFIFGTDPFAGLDIPGAIMSQVVGAIQGYEDPAYEGKLSAEVGAFKQQNPTTDSDAVRNFVAGKDRENENSYRENLKVILERMLPTKENMKWMLDLYHELDTKDEKLLNALVPVARAVQNSTDQSLAHDLVHYARAKILEITDAAKGSTELLNALRGLSAYVKSLMDERLTPAEEQIYNRAVVVKDFHDGYKWVLMLDGHHNPTHSIPNNVSRKTHGNCGVGRGKMYQLRKNNLVVVDASVDDDGNLDEAKGSHNKLPTEKEIHDTLSYMAWFFLHGNNGKPLTGTDFTHSGVPGHDYGMLQLARMSKPDIIKLEGHLNDDRPVDEGSLNPNEKSYASPEDAKQKHRQISDAYRSDKSKAGGVKDVQDGPGFIEHLGQHGLVPDMGERGAIELMRAYHKGDATADDVLGHKELLTHWQAILGKDARRVFDEKLTPEFIDSLLK